MKIKDKSKQKGNSTTIPKGKGPPATAAKPNYGKNKEEGSKANTSRKFPGTAGTQKLSKSFGKQKAQSTADGNKPQKIQKKRNLILKPVAGQKWFQILEQTTRRVLQADTDGPDHEEKPLTKEEIQAIESRAGTLLDNDCQAYRQDCLSGEKRSDFIWMDGIMKNGTLPDKMAAYIVRVQDSPVHNINSLQQLISMVKVQGRQQCLMTADTAKDLFLQDLLPPGRKLLPFDSRANKLRGASDKELILWMFEHRLKLQYQLYLEAIKKMSTDQVDKMRAKAIVVLTRLLISHPEQEQTLLELLVNKLGDPVKKVASRALFHLREVVREHPLMKLIVVQEVERLLFRNNIGKKAQYYGICFLNIISLTHAEAQLAVKLVSVYLAFFKACVKTGEIDSKMMGGLLNGVNRAFPIAKMAGVGFGESLDTLFKIVQLSQFGIGVQALSLLFHVTDVDKNPTQADRFYNSLYRKVLSEDLSTTSHNLQFVNLTYKAMKKDTCVSRVLGFTKRLLQVSTSAPANFACALLYLISEVSKVHKNILLLGSPIKEEPNSDSDSFVEDADASAKENLLNERNLRNFEQLVQTTNIVKKDEQVKLSKKQPVEVPPVIDVEASANDETEAVIEIKDEPETCHVKHYDPAARNPKFCGAEFTFSYELLTLARHAHPSVALFAQTLLRRERIKYTGNPIRDFTVPRFLGRFAYRNPKVNPGLRKYQPAGLRNLPVNSSSYLDAKEEDIPVEEKFFYKYFTSQKKKSTKIKKDKDEDDNDEGSDAESIDDDEFDKIMSNYFKEHGPDEDADSSEDEEIDFASEIKKPKKRKGGKAPDSDEDMDDDEEEPVEDGSDAEADELIEMDSDDEPEYDGDDDDLDNEDDSLPQNIFDDDEDEFINYNAPSTSGRKTKSKLRGPSTFAPAEQFSEILEANADMAFSGSHDLINKDNADMKQLKWEMNRDRWVKGHTNKRKPFKRNNTNTGTKRRKFK